MDPGTAVGVVSLGLQICKGILKYYQDWKGYEDDVRETYTRINDLSKTLTLLRDELQIIPQQAFSTHAQECLTACQDGVQQLEKKLNKLHKEAPVGMRQQARSIGLRVVYPLRKSTLEKLKELAQELIQRLNLAIQVIHMDSSRSIQNQADRIKSTVDTTRTLVTQIEATTLITQTEVSATAANVQVLLSAEQSRELVTILKWLSAPDPSTNHTQARGKHEAGTGEWLFRSREYQDWVSGLNSIFWLYGKAGCCKTILCSTVIEQVSSLASGQHDVAFSYFYFSFSDAQKQSYTNMLLSMVTQLSQERSVHPLLRAAYSRAPSQSPSFEALEPILLALLDEFKTSYLVVDALDECSEEQREQILQGFKRITQAVPKTRLLMTSRKEADIDDLMASWCQKRFPINEACVNEDIDIYVKNALATDKKLVKLSGPIKKEIEDVFHKKSDGMFRWAALQLDNIRNLKILRPAYISRALHEMPRTLDETYARILSSIDSLYFDEARVALEWLAFSMTPLSVAELAEACSIRIDDAQEPFLEEGGYDAIVGLFGVLSSLIAIGDLSDNEPNRLHLYRHDPGENLLPKKYDTVCYSQVVRLAHFSVKEYLVSDRLQRCHTGLSRYALRKTKVQLSLGQACCAYFLYFTKQQNADICTDEPEFYLHMSLKDFAPIYTLLPYVCRYWPRHQALAELGGELLPASARLHLRVLESDQVRTSWLQLKYPLYNGWRGTSSLYCAAFWGLRQTVSLLCNSNQNIDKAGGTYHTALQTAAYMGHDKVVETLVARGANVNCIGGEHGTALEAAAYSGHEKVVKALIACGADVNCNGHTRHGSALQAAASEGNTTIVEMLIANGANVNCQGNCRTALQQAAYQGHETLVDMLIASGADVDSYTRFTNVTALSLAAGRGHCSIVSKLLKADVDKQTLNLKSGKGTALERAASKGYEQVVEELLQAGADHGDALKIATIEGHEGVVRILVEHGAVYEPAEAAQRNANVSVA